jgi:hypothetical protein
MSTYITQMVHFCPAVGGVGMYMGQVSVSGYVHWDGIGFKAGGGMCRWCSEYLLTHIGEESTYD